MKARRLSILVLLLFAALVPATLLRATPTLAAPTPVPTMLGTWFNNNPATAGIVRINVYTLFGTVYVHPYGACHPTPCDMGVFKALVYAPNVSSNAGTAFTATANFGFKTTTFTGVLSYPYRALLFPRLTVISYNHFTDRSGRDDYYYTDVFHKYLFTTPAAPSPAIAPLPSPALLGNWSNLNHVNPGLVKLSLTKLWFLPFLPFRAHAYGACSPTPCDWGAVVASAYSANVSSSVGTAFTAQYTFSFKQTLLAGVLTGNRLVVYEFNHFTDHSARSDYYMVETFAKS